jgi:copper transport protein
MKIRKRHLAILAVLLLYAAWSVVPAFAHALLLRSNPAANAILTSSPPQVELFFSEALQPGLSSISVLDSNGSPVDVGDSRVDSTDPTRMTVSLHTLQEGVFTVTWKAISATDGHFTTGSFPFAVGNVSSAALAATPQKNSAALPLSALLSKWLLLASLALLVGKLPFIGLVWNPSLAEGGAALPEEVREPPLWLRITKIALIGLFVGLALSLLSEAGQVTGSELALPWARQTGLVLTSSRLGAIWLARLGLALICLWLVQSRIQPWKPWATFAAGLALLFTLSLTSHAATGSSTALPVFSDWLHLTGMSFWLGGLVFFLTGLRLLRGVDAVQQTRLTSLAIGRFSIMALLSVGLIGVTGLYAASLRVGSLSALYTSIYGNALLLKQVFVLLLLILAAANLLFFGPRLRRSRLLGLPNRTLASRFRLVVTAEIALGILLLASVSLLTYLPPARIVPPSAGLKASKNADDLKIRLAITPGYVGQNSFVLQITSNGQPVRVVKEALLRFTPAQAAVAPSEAQLIAQGDGSFTAKGSYLSLPGNWQVQAVVRRDNKFDAFANFNMNIGKPGSAGESAAVPKVAAGLILLDGLLLGLAMFSLPGGVSVRFVLGGLMVLMVSAGIIALATPTPVVNSQANPIAPTVQSVAAGKAIFDAQCVPCHGVSGKGDGPRGLALIPRPADLTVHAIPGVHTDAQLFEWITNGFPGSAMPAWRQILSDTDRWNLVNFIRTLAPKTTQP